MREAKEYAFKSQGELLSLLFILPFLAIIIYGIFKLINHPIALLVVMPIPGCMLYLQYHTTRIAFQYSKYDKGKKILISADRLSLTMTQNSIKTVIRSEDVEKVEIYKATSLRRFGSYEYIIIYTNDQRKILITNFTIPLLIYDKALEYFLRKKKRVYFKKRFNYIDVDKISLMY